MESLAKSLLPATQLGNQGTLARFVSCHWLDRLFFNGWNIHSWQKGGLVSSVPSKFGGGVYEHHSSV